jgi:hypothetical protein
LSHGFAGKVDIDFRYYEGAVLFKGRKLNRFKLTSLQQLLAHSKRIAAEHERASFGASICKSFLPTAHPMQQQMKAKWGNSYFFIIKFLLNSVETNTVWLNSISNQHITKLPAFLRAF